MRLIVEGFPTLERDPHTKAIINLDATGADKYQEEKRKRLAEINRIREIENSVSELKEDMNSIKTMLELLINRTGTQ